VGNYEHVLRPVEPLPAKSVGIRPSLISDITADASGELFIYVNDAILLWPWHTDIFYCNNSGTAKVTITRLIAPQMIDTE
jgi:hypothetical protein